MNNQQEMADLQGQITEIQNCFRIGTVIAVDSAGRLARVSWSNGMRSGWLKVLQSAGTAVTIPTATVDGVTHGHSGATVAKWMPGVGDTVLSIHRPGGEGDGWIIGSY